MKVAIIGHSDRDTAIAIAELEAKLEEEVKIVAIEEDNLPKRNNLIAEPFLITNELVPMPFYPKAKHMPKGHQRSYKYHK